MTVEYLVLLLVSAVIMAGAFGLNNGPIKMFKDDAPHLGGHIEKHLETGKAFQEKSGNSNWDAPLGDPF